MVAFISQCHLGPPQASAEISLTRFVFILFYCRLVCPVRFFPTPTKAFKTIDKVGNIFRIRIISVNQSFKMHGVCQSQSLITPVCVLWACTRLWTLSNGSQMFQSGLKELGSTTLRTCSNMQTRTKLLSMLQVSI